MTHKTKNGAPARLIELIHRPGRETYLIYDDLDRHTGRSAFSNGRRDCAWSDTGRYSVPLYGDLWYAGEIACLFGDTNTGKSIYAVQIGQELAAKGHTVAYFDFELSDAQFARRYRSKTGAEHRFSPRFHRLTLAPGESANMVADTYIYNIRLACIETDAEVAIIDNVTWLSPSLDNPVEASTLMQKLIAMKSELGISVLVLAHTPKQTGMRPLTTDQLAGSKRLANFMDSIFAIARCGRSLGRQCRYLKQLKSRCGDIVYGADNVKILEIGKRRSWLAMHEVDQADEEAAMQ